MLGELPTFPEKAGCRATRRLDSGAMIRQEPGDSVSLAGFR